MKPAIAAIFLGLIIVYFLNSAFKITILELELLTHCALRFVTGFFLLGIGVFYAHQLTFKTAIYLVLGLVLADDIFDIYRQVDSFKPEILILSVYMLLWGSLVGYLAARHLKLQRKSV